MQVQQDDTGKAIGAAWHLAHESKAMVIKKCYLHHHNPSEHWVLSWIFVLPLNSVAEKKDPKSTVAGDGILQQPGPHCLCPSLISATVCQLFWGGKGEERGSKG